MFKEYNPIEDEMFNIIDNKGKVVNKKWLPKLSDDDILKAYKNMLFARTADLQIISFQRQGRIFTYPPNYGQEAISRAVGSVMRKEDWLVPAFREMGAYLANGVTLKEIFLYYMGNEDASIFKETINVLPFSVPIASQLLHATGIGYEIKYNKKDQIVYAFVGDAGTSEGDFHEALNFAGAWNVPVIFIVQNNQYGISTPTSVQTASKNIAIKSIAYGIEGIKVDGNDYLAMFSAVTEATKHVNKGSGPVLIEAVTYRKGPHTTSDDPSRYRSKEEELEWDKKDPIKRLKLYLFDKKKWTEAKDKAAVLEYKKEINSIFEEAENYPKYPVENVFKFMFDEMPKDLKDQQLDYEKFLKWKEVQK